MYPRQFFAVCLSAFFPLLSLGCGWDGVSHRHDHAVGEPHATPTFGNPYPGFCPVMGGEVSIEKAKADPELYSDHDGKRYVFCCKECKPRFEQDAEKFISDPEKPKREEHSGQSHDSHDH